MKRQEVNCETGEVVEIDLTAEDIGLIVDAVVSYDVSA